MSKQASPNQEKGKTLYSQLANLLSGSITEVEVVNYPIISPKTPNPDDPFVCFSDHQLAIPQKLLYVIYGYTCEQFRNLYGVLVNLTNTSQQIDSNVSTELFKLTQILLLQNPDHLTALSCRRNLIKSTPHDVGDIQRKKLVSQELDFSKLVLSIPSHSKSAGLWFHRRWCFSQLFPTPDVTIPINELNQQLSSKHNLSSNLPSDVLNQELEFNLRCCDIYPRNYYAWFHRQWLLDQQLTNSINYYSTETDFKNLDLLTEQVRILNFLSVHPRDHSCLNYITFFIRRLVTTTVISSTNKGIRSNQISNHHDPEQTWKFLQNCFSIISDRPEYEPIWAFLKFIYSIQQQQEEEEEEGKEEFKLNKMELFLSFIEPMVNKFITWLQLMNTKQNDIKTDHDDKNTTTHDNLTKDNNNEDTSPTKNINISTNATSSIKNTLAEQTEQKIIRSIHLAMRTFYFIGFSHFNFIDNSSSSLDQKIKDVLEFTKHMFTSTNDDNNNKGPLLLLSSSCTHRFLHLYYNNLETNHQNNSAFFKFFCLFLDQLSASTR